jgi:DNA transposition AAA+ family ATPase
VSDHASSIEKSAQEFAHIVEAVKAEMATMKLSQAKLAKKLGWAPPTLSAILSDAKSYRGATAKKIDQLKQWLAQQEEQRALLGDGRTAPEYWEGPTAKRIKRVLSIAHAYRQGGMVAGVPGIGKTTVLRQYAQKYPQVHYVMMSPAERGEAAALRLLCKTLEVKAANQGAEAGKAAFVAALKDTDALVIIDEAHHLVPAAIDTLSISAEQAKVALVFAGEPALEAKLDANPRVGTRCQARETILEPSPRDIHAQLDAWGIDDEEQRDFLFELVERFPGGPRLLNNVLTLATAQAGEKDPTLKQLKDAATLVSKYRARGEAA